MLEIRHEFETPERPMVISGNIGPRGDGYRPDARMSVDEARGYHAVQIDTFADTAADMVAVFTMNYAEEATGIAQAARAATMPLAVSFTLETDGRLPSGDTLGDAIARTDAAPVGGHPAYYMINCAHPTHFATVLDLDAPWRRPHPRPARQCVATQPCGARREHRPRRRRSRRPRRSVSGVASAAAKLSVVGGCCGTDHRHVASICAALIEQRAAAA